MEWAWPVFIYIAKKLILHSYFGNIAKFNSLLIQKIIMERAREELHKEALKHKEAKENAIQEKCPPLQDVSALEEGS